MIDAVTRQPVRVRGEGDGGPYIMIALAQLDEVRHLLEQHHVRYWVDEDAISLNGKPEVTVVNLGRGSDPRTIQVLLDAA